MAAASRRPAPPIYMLNRYADTSQLTGEPGEGWFKMECDSKKAYGYGENIQEAVKGLALYARLGDDPLITSSLAIRMTDEALRRFNKEFEELPPRPEHETTVWARILTQGDDLIMLTLAFVRPHSHANLACYLVYDRKRASLSIIKLPQVPALALQPVPRRTCNGDYELVLIDVDLVDMFSSRLKRDPSLCVFSPGTAAWETRRVRWSVPVDVDRRFRTDLAFSFQGKGFWADLSQGLEYCDLNAAGDSLVDLSYFPLPCVLDLGKALDFEQPMVAIRTMACDRDSIWFVCIDEGTFLDDDFADNWVSIWTLKLQGQWKKVAKFSIRDLWRFDGFKEAGLPKARVGYPLLNAVDGILHLMLCGKYSKEKNCRVDHMCSFDICNKKLLWHGTVHNLVAIQPAAIPSGFFQTDPAEGAGFAAAPSCSFYSYV